MRGGVPISYTLRSMGQRAVRTLLTIGVMALVVLAVTVMLSLVSGIRRTLVETGEPDNLVVTRKGATNDGSSMVPIEAYRAIAYFPGIATDPATGEPLVSPEMVLQPFFFREDGGRENVLVRGVRPVAFAVHRNVRIIEGRKPRSSSGEAVVGRALLARYPGARLGGELRFGRHVWKVVGVLAAGGSSFESEVWVDVNDLWNDANRAIYSGLRLKTAPGSEPAELQRRIAGDARWALEAKPELDYYREQADSANFLLMLTVVLGLIMGIGAAFGAMNTMFAAVQSRTTEIGTLRALGFSRRSILVSFMAEALAIALGGFVAGVVLAVGAAFGIDAVLHGVAINLRTFTTATVALRVSIEDAMFALALAVLLGVGGGLLPARRAAGLSPVEALRRR
jgi:ABC-type antimicrobial peptide transport system permease subunit